jgi:hypothetical protein
MFSAFLSCTPASFSATWKLLRGPCFHSTLRIWLFWYVCAFQPSSLTQARSVDMALSLAHTALIVVPVAPVAFAAATRDHLHTPLRQARGPDAGR